MQLQPQPIWMSWLYSDKKITLDSNSFYSYVCMSMKVYARPPLAMLCTLCLMANCKSASKKVFLSWHAEANQYRCVLVN